MSRRPSLPSSPPSCPNMAPLSESQSAFALSLTRQLRLATRRSANTARLPRWRWRKWRRDNEALEGGGEGEGEPIVSGTKQEFDRFMADKKWHNVVVAVAVRRRDTLANATNVACVLSSGRLCYDRPLATGPLTTGDDLIYHTYLHSHSRTHTNKNSLPVRPGETASTAARAAAAALQPVHTIESLSAEPDSCVVA